jgi:general secretion pathway protein H
MRRARRRRDGGFSLLEMLAVLAILALIAGMSTQLARPPSPRLRMEASARALCAALRMTRMRAITANEELSVTFDLERKSYFTPAGETALPQDMAVELSIANSRKYGGGGGGILFYPSGGSSGGDVAIVSTEGRAAIGVNWLTGATRCEVS